MKTLVVVMMFLAVAVVAVRLTVQQPSNVTGAVTARRVSDVALVSDTGKTVHLNGAARGALIVLGYTRCTDECPIAVGKVAAAARPLRIDARPDLFFITVDPEHDTPAVLHRYLAVWHDCIVGLTGGRDALRQVSASLGAGARTSPPRDHDTRLFLIDRAGEVIGDVSPEIAVHDLTRLLVSAAGSQP